MAEQTRPLDPAPDSGDKLSRVLAALLAMAVGGDHIFCGYWFYQLSVAER